MSLRSRRAFTFTEVMFAVILLGIGFIMLAGIFPVAIQQTQTTVEESTASTVVQVATRALEQSLTSADVNPTNGLFLRLTQRFDNNNNLKLDVTLWQKLSGGFILPQDPRFAWTALYRRNAGDNFAQVIIFACQARNYSTYNMFDIDRPNTLTTPSVPMATFEPRYLYAYLSDGGSPGEPDLIEFPDPPAGEPDFRDLLAEGCFVVVGDDRVAADDNNTPIFDPGYANGRIYRIGNKRPDLNGTNGGNSQAWELMPGHDMQSPEENLPLRKSQHGTVQSPIPKYDDHVTPVDVQHAAIVYIIGKGYTNPHPDPTMGTDLNFSGFAQDIAVYSTFVRLK